MVQDHTFFWMCVTIFFLSTMLGLFVTLGIQLAKENSDLRIRLGKEDKYIPIPLKLRLLNWSAKYMILLYPTYLNSRILLGVYIRKFYFIRSWIKQINQLKLWRAE